MKRMLAIFAVIITAQGAAADTPEQQGYRLMQEAEQRDSGFGDYVVEGSMTLQSPSGASASRRFIMRTLEVEADGDKRLTSFSEPRDLAGMAALIYSHTQEPDEQWIYLPSLRRTKRLAARDKTGSFAGSEFSFEDIATFELDKYAYRYLGKDTFDDHNCHLVEERPVYEYSGYSRQVECLDEEIFQPRRINYFDLAGRPYKELTFFDYEQFEGRFWRPLKIVMRNLQTGAISTIEWRDYRFGTSLSDKDFRPHVLGRFS